MKVIRTILQRYVKIVLTLLAIVEDNKEKKEVLSQIKTSSAVKRPPVSQISLLQTINFYVRQIVSYCG